MNRPLAANRVNPIWPSLPIGQSYVTVGLSNADFIANPTSSQTALEAALATSDTVCIYDGTYGFSDTADIPSNKTIIGKSQAGVILQMNSGVNKTVLTNADAATGFTTNVKIRNLTVDQQGALQTAGGGLVVTGIQNWELEDVLFKKSYRFNFLSLHQPAGVTNRTGTITLTNDSTSVIGTSTLFSSELNVGDIIKSVANEFCRVESVESNTSLTLTIPWGYATETDTTFKVIQPNSGNTFRRVQFQGTVNDADASGYGLFDDSILEDCVAIGAAGGGCGFVPDHARNVTMTRLISFGHENSGISLETCEGCMIDSPRTSDNLTGNGIQFISGTTECEVFNGFSTRNLNGYSVQYNTTDAGVPRDNLFDSCTGIENSGYAFRNDGGLNTIINSPVGGNNNTGGAIVNTLNGSVSDSVSFSTGRFFDNRAVKSQDRGVWIVAGTNCSVTNIVALDADHTVAGIVDDGTGTTLSDNTT